jgi:nicotinate dehydrogenase subunit A
MKVVLTVNGKTSTIEVDDPQMPLLYALRNDLGLHGPRFGCGLGQCGPVRARDGASALPAFPVGSVGRSFYDPRRLGSSTHPHPPRRPHQQQAVQCGYCINGTITRAGRALSGFEPHLADKRPVRPCRHSCAR